MNQKSALISTAEEILSVRRHYPQASLADLYDARTMPMDLLSAHKKNDKEVMKAYSFSTHKETTDTEYLAMLFNLYSIITSNK
jgi:transaldolase